MTDAAKVRWVIPEDFHTDTEEEWRDALMREAMERAIKPHLVAVLLYLLLGQRSCTTADPVLSRGFRRA